MNGLFLPQRALSCIAAFAASKVATLVRDDRRPFVYDGPGSMLVSTLDLSVGARQSRERPVCLAPLGALPLGALWNMTTVRCGDAFLAICNFRAESLAGRGWRYTFAPMDLCCFPPRLLADRLRPCDEDPLMSSCLQAMIDGQFCVVAGAGGAAPGSAPLVGTAVVLVQSWGEVGALHSLHWVDLDLMRIRRSVDLPDMNCLRNPTIVPSLCAAEGDPESLFVITDDLAGDLTVLRVSTRNGNVLHSLSVRGGASGETRPALLPLPRRGQVDCQRSAGQSAPLAAPPAWLVLPENGDAPSLLEADGTVAPLPVVGPEAGFWTEPLRTTTAMKGAWPVGPNRFVFRRNDTYALGVIDCPSLSELEQSGGRRRPAGSASFQPAPPQAPAAAAAAAAHFTPRPLGSPALPALRLRMTLRAQAMSLLPIRITALDETSLLIVYQSGYKSELVEAGCTETGGDRLRVTRLPGRCAVVRSVPHAALGVVMHQINAQKEARVREAELRAGKL
jgi:hypothetical protein